MTVVLSLRQGVWEGSDCLLNWSWRHAPGGSEWIEPDSQSALGNHSPVVPRQLV